MDNDTLTGKLIDLFNDEEGGGKNQKDGDVLVVRPDGSRRHIIDVKGDEDSNAVLIILG